MPMTLGVQQIKLLALSTTLVVIAFSILIMQRSANFSGKWSTAASPYLGKFLLNFLQCYLFCGKISAVIITA